MHLDNISLPQVIVSSNYDVFSWKISSRWSVQFLHQLLFFGSFLLFRHIHSQYMTQMIERFVSALSYLFNAMSRLYLHVILKHGRFFLDLIQLIFESLHALLHVV